MDCLVRLDEVYVFWITAAGGDHSVELFRGDLAAAAL